MASSEVQMIEAAKEAEVQMIEAAEEAQCASIYQKRQAGRKRELSESQVL
jgi:hypothetical protein